MEEELRALKVVDLQSQLKALGLNTKGKKDELIARLMAAKSDNKQAGEKRPLEQVEEQEAPKTEQVVAAVEAVEAVEAAAPVPTATTSSNQVEEKRDETVVLVTGFVRPFTEQQAREYVGGAHAGTLGRWQMSVTRVWAVAQFATHADAVEAVARVHDSVWPARNAGSKLSAKLAPNFDEGVRMATGQDAKPEEKPKPARRTKENDEEPPAAKAAKVDEQSSRIVQVSNFLQTKTKPVLFYSVKQ